MQILLCNGALGTCCSDPGLVVTMNAFRKIAELIQIIVQIDFYLKIFKIFKKNVIYVKNLFILLNYIMPNVVFIFFVVNVLKAIMKIISNIKIFLKY